MSNVITHNTSSLDGADKDFALDIDYEVAERFEAPIRLNRLEHRYDRPWLARPHRSGDPADR